MLVGNYRHELKYFIYQTQFGVLENSIKPILKYDVHSKDGYYNIRSLYFDDYNNSCFYDNENGNDPREKFRIRIYNHSTDRIVLECKRKENGKTLKSSCLITEEQCLTLMNGKIIEDYNSKDPLLKKLCSKILTQRMKPKIIIEYDRKIYVCKEGNVRITFDTNISSSNYLNKFLDNNIPKRSIMPVGLNLLEVKYDGFLPDTIYNALQLDSLSQTAFSKYYYGRKYELGNCVSIMK